MAWEKAQRYFYCRVGDAREEPFRLAALGTLSQGISDLHDFIENRYEIGALLTLAGTALKTLDILIKMQSMKGSLAKGSWLRTFFCPETEGFFLAASPRQRENAELLLSPRRRR